MATSGHERTRAPEFSVNLAVVALYRLSKSEPVALIDCGFGKRHRISDRQLVIEAGLILADGEPFNHLYGLALRRSDIVKVRPVDASCPDD